MAPYAFLLSARSPELSPLAINALSDGVLDQAMERDLVVLAWSPLGGGRLLTDTSSRTVGSRRCLLGSLSELALSTSAPLWHWVMANPHVEFPINRITVAARIREARDALRVSFSRAEWYSVLVDVARREAAMTKLPRLRSLMV